jgi:hypothetical protein
MVSLKNLLNNQRYGYFLIWGHGLSYKDEILQRIRRTKFIDILWLQKYNPTSMEKFIKIVYTHCDVPSYHLKAKTEYLLHIPSETFLIFFRNNNPDERHIGDGPFRLLQCMRIKKLKEEIRNQYNPRKNGRRTEYHIIHASDNEIQVNFILKYLGYKDGIDFFKNKPNSNLLLPPFLAKFNSFRIKKINSSQLFCNVLRGDTDSFKTETVRIKETPHYAFLSGDKKSYKNYLDKFLGGPLRCDYNIDNFSKLSKTMRYLKHPHSSSYIITEEIEPNKYLILDGLHRASILLFNNISSFPVVVK